VHDAGKIRRKALSVCLVIKKSTPSKDKQEASELDYTISKRTFIGLSFSTIVRVVV
jgi:hypothetical protein